MEQQFRLAIVEDNSTARTNLRSHLLPFGCFEIFSYSNGNELRAALKRQPLDIILIDYHLGQYKNGVEVIHSLLISGHVKPSTGIFFVTADRQPRTIGQIMDLHPDVLIVKPYTMASLTRSMRHYLEVRELTRSVMKNMDSQNYAIALREMKGLLLEAQKRGSKTSKYLADLNKLFARLLLHTGFYSSALSLYESVLQRSDKVLWAQWGKIKCQYLLGDWDACQQSLNFLIKTNLTRDKAFEWLACLSIASDAYEQASDYLDNINTSEMSTAATRLKSIAYKKQNKVLDGIDLLQRQREHNRSTRDLFDEFTYELAEFYISIAESAPMAQRDESLSQARKLIGMAARGESDPQLKIKKDVLIAYTAVLENDTDRAQKVLDGLPALALHNAPPSAMFCAAKSFHALGDTDTARTLLTKAEKHLQRANDQTWTTSMEIGLSDSETAVGLDQEKALRLNEQGMTLFSQKQAEKAMPLFFEAYERLPSMPAFGLNLLQCLIELKRPTYRKLTADLLVDHVSSLPLNESNQQRLSKLREDMAVAMG